MSIQIDNLINQKKSNQELVQECSFENQNHLGMLLKKIYQPLGTTPTQIRLLLLCNWCDSKTLCDNWNRMSKGDYTWNNIRIVWEEPADYYVIINSTPVKFFIDPKKTILFQMEPHMELDNKWGEWSKPTPSMFKFCGTHNTEYNNNEWHLSKTYSQLSNEEIIKTSNILSTVISNKYNDPGHKKRIDFIKFLENKGMDVNVYGGNTAGWKNYQGGLPYCAKDDGMFPYKYVFNAENHEINNYYTEKLIDGILAECLVFYWGCPNIFDFFDERALVKLELVDFEKDFEIITRALRENWYEMRLPYIREAKKKILNKTQFFPRIERILA